ncbi:MAG: PDDEXK nuclease domain-containing protein [Bacteroidetes bacterium]|nr:PDDEXK nuclease domain-containing protein [Bacteroidota bacterium]
MNYIEAIKAIKQAILKSRYRAAAAVNREMLSLYFGIGEYISKNSRDGFWGTNAIENISEQLQKELPGLRGFSASNMKRMRQFFEAWEDVFVNRSLPMSEIRQLTTGELENDELNRPLTAGEIRPPLVGDLQMADNQAVINRPLTVGDLEVADLQYFLQLGFSLHCVIIEQTNSLEERLFYIRKCATGFWSKEKLRYNLKSNLYAQQGSMINNFVQTISQLDFRGKALRAFKDEYLLDMVNIEDPDEEDEREIENEIVRNIKKFILALGTDFTFIGNQHRLIVDEREFFVDLLFFNRKLQSLVAFDLKKRDFKPEYVGKMNFYLSALDEYVKMPHENPSIGIILCKDKSNKIVEFAFRDTSKPMGVATYKTARELPPEYVGILPDVEKLKELMV